MRISDWSSDVCSSDLRWHRLEATYRLDQHLQLAVVGLEHVVQIFHLPVLGFRRQFAFAFQLSDCCAVAGCLVGIEFGRLFPVLQATKSFAQKALRRFGAACRCQIEITRVAPFVDRPVQVGPFAPHLYVRLIQTPPQIKAAPPEPAERLLRSEDHTSEIKTLMSTS